MRHHPVRALALACAIAAMPLAVHGAATQVVASSQATLLVTVLASSKAPITDLTAKDFKVTDGGQAIQVTAAERATDPLSIEVVVDNAQPPMGVTAPTRDLRSALQTFAKAIRAGNPEAKIGMFTAGGAATPVVPLGGSAADFDNGVNHIAPSPQSGGEILEGLVDAARALGAEPAPRRAIVSIDFSSPDEASDTVLRNIETAVFQSGASVWAVSVSGSNTTETPSRDAVLNEAPKMSGGQRETIVGSTGLQNQLKVIANSLLSQYALQIPRPAGDVKALKIEVPKGKVYVASFVR
jgi:hypothetical protein